MRFPGWTKEPNPIRRLAHCSFCGKNVDQVGKLINGPGVCICDECVALCNRILAEEGVTPS